MTSIDALIPVRAPAPWLGQALEGLAHQTKAVANIIIVIHGQADHLREEISTHDLPIRILTAEDHLTLSDVLNIGLAASEATFVARLDADDVPRPRRLEVQSAFLDINPACAVVGSSATLINDQGNVIGIRESATPSSQMRSRMMVSNCLIHPSVMFRRRAILNVGGYRPQAQLVEDYDLWLRVLTGSDIAAMKEPLTIYRLHSQQITRRRSVPQSAQDAILESRLELAKSMGMPRSIAKTQHFVWRLKQQWRAAHR